MKDFITLLYLILPFFLRKIKADDFPSDSSTSIYLTLGVTKNGNVEVSGDEDWFKINLVAGTTYEVSNKAVSSSDPVVRIKGPAPSTSLIASNDDYGGTYDALIMFQPTTTGDYFIIAACFLSTTGSYQLKVSIAPCPGDCICTIIIKNHKIFYR